MELLPDLKTCTSGLTASNQVQGWLLTVGTFASFVPQVYLSSLFLYYFISFIIVYTISKYCLFV